MGIESTYKDILTEGYIKYLAKNNPTLSVAEIAEALEDYFEDKDLSKPLFDAGKFKVAPEEQASANKIKAMSGAVYQDLVALFEEINNIANQAITNYERWDNELDLILKTLTDLESQAGDLLLTRQDTDGYVNYVADYSVDLSKIDQDNTQNLEIDTVLQNITIQPSAKVYQPINITERTKLSFNAISNSGTLFQSARGSELKNILSDQNTFWQTRISSENKKPVTGELIIHMSDGYINLSRIEMHLHNSNNASDIQITPLYSMDGFTYKQLPTVTPSLNAVDNAVFSFEQIQATDIKFLLTKKSHDDIENKNYIYEFGIKLIQFYTYAFDKSSATTSTNKLVSKPLYVNKADGTPLEFSKVSLETCECIEDDTNIRYYITMSNDSSVPVTSSTSWIRIDPAQRIEKEVPSEIDVGDLSVVELGDTETVTVSYDALGSEDTGLKNPDADFYLVGLSGGSFVATTPSATVNRFMLINSNDRILNYQLKSPENSAIVDIDSSYFLIDNDALRIFRNVGEKGLTGQSNEVVRDIQRGWGFADPWYYCVVNIENEDGFTIDVGSENIIIDDTKYNSLVTIPYGVHKVQVHKDNWLHVTADLDSLSALLAADPLYPYNHKMLIEGYSYGSSYTEETVYNGVDLFAQYLLNEISPTDFFYTIPTDGYRYFARDWDLPDSYSNTYGNMLFLIKIDDLDDDWENERFYIKFRAVDTKYKYLRLRADFETENTKVAPSLRSYKIKLI